MRNIGFLGAWLLALPFFSQAIDCPILPAPVTYTLTGRTPEFLTTQELSFEVGHLPQEMVSVIPQIAGLYLASPEKRLAFTPQAGLIQFQTLTGAYPESYSISITSTQIRIAYTSTASCFHAIHSLFQLLQEEPSDSSIRFPQCFVKDFPKFQWRGLHVDVSRHFFTVEELKKFLDLMSMYKFNMFHWHLTDDQGWRIEIKRYPKLTEIGAWRDSTVQHHYSTYPRTWDTTRYGGFYTQAQIKEVVAYAAARQITVVPEIEMPGHARSALAAYPEYSCTGIAHDVPGLWGVFDDVFCTKDSTLLFLQNILAEVIPLFPGPYVHIGGDEVPKTRWHTCPQCQAKIKQLELQDEHELQSYFIRQMDRYISSMGRKLIGWDEILEGGLSPNAAVMSWRGTEGGIAAAKQGHYAVMTPGSHCYFDHYQGKSASEPLAIGGYTPLEKVYEFDPVPRELNAQEANYILGGQGNLWTEYIPTFDQLTYMAFPRAIALSQALWCTQKPSYSSFEKTLKTHHIPRLTGPLLNTRVSLTFMKPTPQFEREREGISLQFLFKDTNESVFVSFTQREAGIWLSQGKKLYFKRSQKKSLQHKFNYFSTCCSDSFTIIEHQGLGTKVEYVTPPNARYNSGDLTLVDGQFGARPWRGYQWVGFDTNVVELVLDLQKPTKIKGIDLGFLHEPTSWIHVPERVCIATDRKKYREFLLIGERSPLKLQAKTQKIYLKIIGMPRIPEGFPGAGNAPWIFMDEIIVR